MQDRAEIHVMAGVLSDADGRILIAQRPAGRHLAGRWEFPGGKLDAGEAPLPGLTRELAEELGVTLQAAEPLFRLRHAYVDRSILLDAWRVTRYAGCPRSLDSQLLDWVAVDDLTPVDLLEADRPVVTALRLPALARCISGLASLSAAAQGGAAETLFWSPARVDPASGAAREAVRAARLAGHRVLVVGDAIAAAQAAAASGADGLLIEPSAGRVSIDRDGTLLVGAVCPTPASALAAVRAGVHFLVLAPAGAAADERRFAPALQRLNVPAYIGWYSDARRAELARAAGAHGAAVGPFPGTRSSIAFPGLRGSGSCT